MEVHSSFGHPKEEVAEQDFEVYRLESVFEEIESQVFQEVFGSQPKQVVTLEVQAIKAQANSFQVELDLVIES